MDSKLNVAKCSSSYGMALKTKKSLEPIFLILKKPDLRNPNNGIDNCIMQILLDDVLLY